eukprot:XP_001705419.1 Hypothetical protein GL50803_27238 [Giardia lamblia ATCC 50803]
MCSVRMSSSKRPMQMEERLAVIPSSVSVNTFLLLFALKRKRERYAAHMLRSAIARDVRDHEAATSCSLALRYTS